MSEIADDESTVRDLNLGRRARMRGNVARINGKSGSCATSGHTDRVIQRRAAKADACNIRLVPGKPSKLPGRDIPLPAEAPPNHRTERLQDRNPPLHESPSYCPWPLPCGFHLSLSIILTA
jgi:hypothetical protein